MKEISSFCPLHAFLFSLSGPFCWSYFIIYLGGAGSGKTMSARLLYHTEGRVPFCSSFVRLLFLVILIVLLVLPAHHLLLVMWVWGVWVNVLGFTFLSQVFLFSHAWLLVFLEDPHCHLPSFQGISALLADDRLCPTALLPAAGHLTSALTNDHKHIPITSCLQCRFAVPVKAPSLWCPRQLPVEPCPCPTHLPGLHHLIFLDDRLVPTVGLLLCKVFCALTVTG